MPQYNAFEEYIGDSVREKHDALMAQTRALFDASNLLNDAMNSSLLSQKELSKYLGISKGYVSRLLSGTENVSLKNLAKILHMLGYELNLSASQIISDKNENIIWADFGTSGPQSRIETCSVFESPSPWSDTYIPKAM